MKAKFSLFIITFSLLLPFWGSWALCEFEHALHRKSIKRSFLEALPEKSLTRISVHRAFQFIDLDWEHEHEFGWRGDMYDIVYQQGTVDSLVYWCWLDSKENELQKKLENVLKLTKHIQGNESNTPPNLEFFKFQLLPSAAKDDGLIEPINTRTYHEMNAFYKSPDQSGFGQPPERHA